MIKMITVDGFYSRDEALRLANAVWDLSFVESELGKQIENFNLTPGEPDALFSKVLRFPVTLDERSGVFRFPKLFIHFEGFDNSQEWCFVVALQASTFNVFQHKSGAKSALDGHQFSYRNLLEWDLTVNYLLEPGQGIFFRPWLFHAFDSGLVQIFRLSENV